MESFQDETILYGDEQHTLTRLTSFRRIFSASAEVALLPPQFIAVGHNFEFHANGVGDRDDGASFEFRKPMATSVAKEQCMMKKGL